MEIQAEEILAKFLRKARYNSFPDDERKREGFFVYSVEILSPKEFPPRDSRVSETHNLSDMPRRDTRMRIQ